MNPKREKCAAAGRYVRQIQREHLREVAKGLKDALEAVQEAFIHKPGDIIGNRARTAPLKHCNAEFSTALNNARIALEAALSTLRARSARRPSKKRRS